MSLATRVRPIRRALRCAFTLVEMLIAMVLTLFLTLAISEFYAYVGASVKDGRAMIDLVAQLRIATTQLKSDLDRLTLAPRPPADDANSSGYFEIFEGFGKDWDANANNLLDATEDVDANGVFDFIQNNYSSMLGDIDDVLAFTIKSDTDPLVGYGFKVNTQLNANDGTVDFTTPQAYSSSRAEVVWFSSFVDQDGDNVWDPAQAFTPGANWEAEPRILHRRQLIVDESLNTLHPQDNNVTFPYFFRIPNTPTAIFDGMQMFDVAVTPTRVPGGPPVVVANYQYFFAKRFYDLTRRENRFARQFSFFPNSDSFSERIDLNAHLMQRDTTVPLTNNINYGSMARWVQQGLRKGDDVIMSNMLSFDVRVFDPFAPIRADGDSTGATALTTDDAIGVVQPGDAGWNDAVAANLANNNVCQIVGVGAFVDLAYDRYLTTAVNAGFSNFPVYPGFAARRPFYIHGNVPPGPAVPAPPPYFPGLGATYDTWATSYERDGILQLAIAGRMDLASNGLDDTEIINGTYVGGVDDITERETSPPYPSPPLRGIQIKVRAGEPSTRQVRQATIGWDFIAD